MAKLRSKNADFICLQEAFYNNDRQYLLQKLTSLYPHNQYFQQMARYHPKQVIYQISSQGSSCSTMDLITVSRCLMSKQVKTCRKNNFTGTADCIQKYCPSLMKISRQDNTRCWSCLYALGVENLASPSIWEILNRCLLGRVISAYGMNPGVMVFSKYPFKKVKKNLYHWPNFVQRGGISVEMDLGAGKAIKVGCSHTELTADYFGFDILKIRNYPQENYQQLQYLANDTISLSTNNLPLILLGDFNVDPYYWNEEKPGEVFPSNHDNLHRFLNEFGLFTSPRHLKEDYGHCTYCPNNTNNMALNTKNKKNEEYSQIDHILWKNPPPSSKVGSIQLIKTEIATSPEENLSDHQALFSVFSWQPNSTSAPKR